MLDDFALLEATPASTAFSSEAYFHVVARSCAAFLHELRGERIASDRVAAQAATATLGTYTVRKAPWLARLAAHRGSADEAFEWLERETGAGTVATTIATSQLLEARCDVVAELGLWDLADATVSASRAFAESALAEALPLHADRLEGRAAVARGDASLALSALTRARDGFAALGARWEEALANLWLAQALRIGEAEK